MHNPRFRVPKSYANWKAICHEAFDLSAPSPFDSQGSSSKGDKKVRLGRRLKKPIDPKPTLTELGEYCYSFVEDNIETFHDVNSLAELFPIFS